MSSSTSHPNKRLANRKKSLLPGIVTTLDGSNYFDCALKDISQSGACINFRKSAKFTPYFLIINIRDRVAHHCSLVWQKESSAGVRYHSTISLASRLDPKLHFLKRLWLEGAVR